MDVTESWHLADETATLTGEQAATLVRRRIDEGNLTTWLEHEDGRALAVVSNRVRAMVMLLDEPGDAGQHDTYDNRDTIPLEHALSAVRHLVDFGCLPGDITWHIDR